MKKEDIAIITTPFILTALLVVFGYNLLISSTPEARLTLPPEQNNVEILDSADLKTVLNAAPTPQQINANITVLPQNRTQLAAAINTALESNQALYLTVPLTISPDGTLELTGVHDSSRENLINWAKKTINTAHENNIFVMMALSINASATINDSEAFLTQYQPILSTWSKLATEYKVSYFSPGITASHPVYSEYTPQEFQKLLANTIKTARTGYQGKLGISVCCTDVAPQLPLGFNYSILVPTAEFDLPVLLPIASTLKSTRQIPQAFQYNRGQQQVKLLNLN